LFEKKKLKVSVSIFKGGAVYGEKRKGNFWVKRKLGGKPSYPATEKQGPLPSIRRTRGKILMWGKIHIPRGAKRL